MIDRHETRSKLGQLLVMSHEEQFDYHSVAVNDENGFDSKVWMNNIDYSDFNHPFK